MKFSKIFSILILPAILFIGCAHTNELAKYNLMNKNILFKQWVNPALTHVEVDINSSYESSNPFVVILSNIGSSYSESLVREKIQNNINADSIVKSISDGLKEGLNTYYRINAVNSLDDNPDYILETKLNKFKLSSNSQGIFVRIDCSALITDRNSAKTVWENQESVSIPLYDVILSYGETTQVRTTASVINAVRLMNMNDEEFRLAIDYAVEEAGKKQSDQLREDIANKSN